MVGSFKDPENTFALKGANEYWVMGPTYPGLIKLWDGLSLRLPPQRLPLLVQRQLWWRLAVVRVRRPLEIYMEVVYEICDSVRFVMHVCNLSACKAWYMVVRDLWGTCHFVQFVINAIIIEIHRHLKIYISWNIPFSDISSLQIPSKVKTFL